MSIIAVGLNHRSAPVQLRERFAFSEATLPAALRELRQTTAMEEAVILSTCNRVEIYAATAGNAREGCERLHRFLHAHHGQAALLESELYRLEEPQSVVHLFRVACGLDSMVLGETEILGQLKRAYELARHHGHTGARLNRVFQRAFSVAKHVRTQTNIQRGSTSVASVAVELTERIFQSLSDRCVLVIGAGDTSEKTARALSSRGVRGVRVANRTWERAAELANALGGQAVPFERLAEELARADIVISSTAAPRYVLDRTLLASVLRGRRDRPLLLIDLAVPRDIEPEVNFLEGVYLYNIDDLQSIAEDALRLRREEVARCEAIIAERARALLDHPPRDPKATAPHSPCCTPQPTPADGV
jgi:glutamyl-tRNA reductase